MPLAPFKRQKTETDAILNATFYVPYLTIRLRQAICTCDKQFSPPEDYVAVDSEPLLLGPVAVAGGSICWTVPLIDDEISEPMESFSVTLESESNNTSVEGTSRARVTILDDDSKSFEPL